MSGPSLWELERRGLRREVARRPGLFRSWRKALLAVSLLGVVYAPIVLGGLLTHWFGVA